MNTVAADIFPLPVQVHNRLKNSTDTTYKNLPVVVHERVGN
jgi:hypothetical protein